MTDRKMSSNGGKHGIRGGKASPPCFLGFGTVRQCFNLCRGECGYKPKDLNNECSSSKEPSQGGDTA